MKREYIQKLGTSIALQLPTNKQKKEQRASTSGWRPKGKSASEGRKEYALGRTKSYVLPMKVLEMIIEFDKAGRGKTVKGEQRWENGL